MACFQEKQGMLSEVLYHYMYGMTANDLTKDPTDDMTANNPMNDMTANELEMFCSIHGQLVYHSRSYFEYSYQVWEVYDRY